MKNYFLFFLYAISTGCVHCAAKDVLEETPPSLHSLAIAALEANAHPVEDIQENSLQIQFTPEEYPANVLWCPPKEKYNITGNVNITNGSLLGFVDASFIGNLIRHLSDDEKYGLSHVGVAVVAYPTTVVEMIQKSWEYGGLSTRKPKYYKKQLDVLYKAYPYLCDIADGERPADEKLDVFCFESVGSLGEVFHGYAPRVQITPLAKVIKAYNGNVCVRPLDEAIPLKNLQQQIIDNLGISYEKKILQLLRSTGDGNDKEDGSSWFCSELAAYLYKKNGVIAEEETLANNVIPMEFSTRSTNDFLRGKASDEQWLKLIDDFSNTYCYAPWLWEDEEFLDGQTYAQL